jgi:hypothetical protein
MVRLVPVIYNSGTPAGYYYCLVVIGYCLISDLDSGGNDKVSSGCCDA